MLAAYAVPAVAAWAVIGLVLTALPVTWVALAAVVAYGGYYGAMEVSGRRGLPPPGRRWQVPQSMMIDASPRRRVLVWGAILGPGFATRNPYAGFGVLPLVVAGTAGTWPAVALGATIGLAHGTARAAALLRDVRDLRAAQPMAAGPAAAVADVAVAHLDLLLKTVYWRRLDGIVLLAVAATAFAAVMAHLT